MELKKSDDVSANALCPHFKVAHEVDQAKRMGMPIVALESTVITHGLPWPENLHLALEMEKTVRKNGAVPATIAVMAGMIKVGLSATELENLAQDTTARKVSLRDFGAVLFQGGNGGTTVAATMFAAESQGIRVFATGGIGGVHRNAPFDVSADLMQLGRSPVLVVCAGAKSILDIAATVEYLETQGVPVMGYQTEDFPAFFSRKSGIKNHFQAQSPQEVAQIAKMHWEIGLKSGILLAVPPPEATALPFERMEEIISQALIEAEAEGVHGSALTPYLLVKVNQLSGGESLKANLALLLNNATVAAQVAAQLANKVSLSMPL